MLCHDGPFDYATHGCLRRLEGLLGLYGVVVCNVAGKILVVIYYVLALWKGVQFVYLTLWYAVASIYKKIVKNLTYCARYRKPPYVGFGVGFAIAPNGACATLAQRAAVTCRGVAIKRPNGKVGALDRIDVEALFKLGWSKNTTLAPM